MLWLCVIIYTYSWMCIKFRFTPRNTLNGEEKTGNKNQYKQGVSESGIK